MDIKQIRINNLETLISGFKTLIEFSEAAEMDPSYASQLRNGHSNIGNKVAKKLELRFKKPDGWMDIQHNIDALAAGSDVISGTAEPLTEYTKTPDMSNNNNKNGEIIELIAYRLNRQAFKAAWSKLDKEFPDWKNKELETISMIFEPFYEEGLLDEEERNN